MATHRAKAAPFERYNAKRDFAVTPEPEGKVEKRRNAKRSFVVQKHAATRLHWDFRLEMDGVLKSWAVTRGPSADPAEKRLAVRTEDHPLSYGKFEGTIPKDEYGGGTVMLWDRGTWELLPGKHDSDLEEGHLHFILHGTRMKGEWLLIRLKPRPGERGENWLLRKIEDEFAETGDTLVKSGLTSVTTSRTMDDIARAKPARRQRKAAKGPLPAPAYRKPMLATLSTHVPKGAEWWYEIKFDGYRCLLAVGTDEVRGWTRSGLDWIDRYGSIGRAARKLDCRSALIDGEVIALDADGRPSFSRLQHELKQAEPDLAFFAFDLLERDGEDLASLPLSERKAQLEELFADPPEPLRLSVHTRGDGQALLTALAVEGHEGIVAKRVDAPYRHGRSTAWLKIKTGKREEFVIAGWEPSDKHGRAIRSILLAQREGGKLVYKGKVGTGFDEEAMADLCRRFGERRVKTSPLGGGPKPGGRPRWLKPDLVAEVRYAELTGEGVVRHATFVGLREDKPAEEVMPESQVVPIELPAVPAGLPISHPERAIFGQGAATKGQLAAWYELIAPFALRWMANRPLSLVRCPQGIAAKCFFQKHLKEGWGDELVPLPIEQADGEIEEGFYTRDVAGLLRCVQMGAIEIHGWGAPASAIECPDRLVFDLDPDTGLDFTDVVGAARFLREGLAEAGLVTFPMVTGGKGVHVIAPLDGSANWEAVEHFARSFALALEQAQPARFTASMSKARRKGRIFVDWLRNQRSSTAVMPWSARARQGAPVATPVDWEELPDLVSANQFTLAEATDLIERARRLDGTWGVRDQALPDL